MVFPWLALWYWLHAYKFLNLYSTVAFSQEGAYETYLDCLLSIKECDNQERMREASKD